MLIFLFLCCCCPFAKSIIKLLPQLLAALSISQQQLRLPASLFVFPCRQPNRIDRVATSLCSFSFPMCVYVWVCDCCTPAAASSQPKPVSANFLQLCCNVRNCANRRQVVATAIAPLPATVAAVAGPSMLVSAANLSAPDWLAVKCKHF